MGFATSLRSQKLISQFRAACDPIESEVLLISSPQDIERFFYWLDNNKSILLSIKSKKELKKIEFIKTCLCTELLHDLHLSLLGDNTVAIKEENSSLDTKLKLVLLIAAGALVAACEGFDSIVTMLSVFSLPAAILFTLGVLFALLSVLAYCGLDLMQISNALGVRLGNAHQVLDVYIQQLEEVKQLRRIIDNYDLSKLSLEELNTLQAIMAMLQNCYHKLVGASEQFQEVLENDRLYLTKLVVSAIASSIFYGGGFCAGQTMALYVCGLFMTTITPASAPVLLFSMLVGFAAFSLYWCTDIPSISEFMGNWFGLSEKKINTICDRTLLNRVGEKLTALNNKIISATKREEIEHYNLDKKTLSVPVTIKISDNIYSFVAQERPKYKTPGEDVNVKPELPSCFCVL
ncbi:MAG: hypothetical protein QM652_04710 [Legionella sp.]|uniref:hypothetical protein n=1 Tax=Legionella sp. TaxID=459 RepID=UPI0039E38B3D